ncbi:MAG TPA: hypothetical protein VHE81_14330 [Lacipirellulaceae bacterium]|nr:hypothetical protein [Lacipirellulaceae bacterium]
MISRTPSPIKFVMPVVTALVFVLVPAARWARAGTRYYSIVTNQSHIDVSGQIINSYGKPTIQPQGTGSLSTTYSGSIKTDRTGNNISFLSGSSIDANTNGNWQPLADGSSGSAAADYGGKATFLGFVTVNFAGRNLAAGLTSGALPIDAGDDFDLSTTDMTFSSGSIAYRASIGDPASSGSIVGTTGTLTGSGLLSSVVQGLLTTETLTIPIDSLFLFQPDSSTTINLTLTGTLVAKASFRTPLPGDYNNNGAVDAGDYVMWRKKIGNGTSLPNDDTVGVGQDDYARWRTHFGEKLTAGGSGGNLLAGSTVPEASTLALVAVVLVFVGVSCRRGW